MAVIVEGYSETIKENNAIISPEKVEEVLEKWCIYDTDGSGFIETEDLAFLLHDIYPPIGYKSDKNRFYNIKI